MTETESKRAGSNGNYGSLSDAVEGTDEPVDAGAESAVRADLATVEGPREANG